MIRTANIETTTLPPGIAPGAASAQGANEGSQTFIDSLLTASNAIANTAGAKDGSSKLAGQQGFNTSDFNATGGAQSGRPVQLANQPQQTGQAQGVSTARNLKDAVPSQIVVTAAGEVRSRNAASLKPSAATVTPFRATIPSGVQSKLNSRVGDLLKAAWASTGSKVQGIKAFANPSIKPADQGSNIKTLPRISSSAQNVTQTDSSLTPNEVQTSVWQGLAVSFSNTVPSTLSTPAPEGIQSVKSVLPNAAQASVPSAEPAAPVHQVHTPQTAADQAAVSVATSGRSSEVKSSAASAAIQNIRTSAAPVEAQTAAPFAGPEAIHTLPKTSLHAGSDVISIGSPTVLENSEQASVQSGGSNSLATVEQVSAPTSDSRVEQNPIPEAAQRAVFTPTSNVSSKVVPNANLAGVGGTESLPLSNPAPGTTPMSAPEGRTSLPKTMLDVFSTLAPQASLDGSPALAQAAPTVAASEVPSALPSAVQATHSNVIPPTSTNLTPIAFQPMATFFAPEVRNAAPTPVQSGASNEFPQLSFNAASISSNSLGTVSSPEAQIVVPSTAQATYSNAAPLAWSNVPLTTFNGVPTPVSTELQNAAPDKAHGMVSNVVPETPSNVGTAAAQASSTDTAPELQNGKPGAVSKTVSDVIPQTKPNVAPVSSAAPRSSTKVDSIAAQIVVAGPASEARNAGSSAVQSTVSSSASETSSAAERIAAQPAATIVIPEAQKATVNAAPVAPQNTSPDNFFDVAANTVTAASPVAIAAESQEVVAIPTPEALSNPLTDDLLNASTVQMQDAGQTPAPEANNLVQRTVLSAKLDANLNDPSIPMSNAVLTPASNPVVKAVVPTGPSAAPNTVHNAVPSVIRNQNANVAPNPGVTAPLNADHAQASHSATNPHGVTDNASASSQSAVEQSNAQPASSDQSNVASALFIPGAAAEQLNVLTQWRAGSLALGQSGELAMGPEPGAKLTDVSNEKGATKDTTASPATCVNVNQNSQSTTIQAGSQTGSLDATSSGNQGQGTANFPAQNMAPAQANFAAHAAAAHGMSTASDTTAQIPSSPARGAGHSAAGTENGAAATTSAPTSQPVVNTAKLIQNLSQSEMHVGMRSNEFGNISINTSAAKEGIVAQISVDHGELAKSLAAHLPEMQARLGGNQQMDVRIDVNGDRAGQGTGAAGGGSNGANGANGSGEDARGSRRQAANTSASPSGSGYPGGSFQPAAAAAIAGGRYTSRLDIRI